MGRKLATCSQPQVGVRGAPSIDAACVVLDRERTKYSSSFSRSAALTQPCGFSFIGHLVQGTSTALYRVFRTLQVVRHTEERLVDYACTLDHRSTPAWL